MTEENDEEVKTLRVSREMWAKLMSIKIKNNLTSIEDAIDMLLKASK